MPLCEECEESAGESPAASHVHVLGFTSLEAVYYRENWSSVKRVVERVIANFTAS